MASRREAIEQLLTRGVEQIIDRSHLAAALASGRKLTVKFGIDPTTPNLHLGHLVVFRKLRQFQDLGHLVVFLVGDFTATIGDPSGRAEARQPLTDHDVTLNMRSYVEQASRILDRKRLTVRYNSEWFKKADFTFALKLLSRATVSRVIEREDFRERIKAGKDVTMLEAFYALLQGYDSVALKSDVEIGGADQLLNLLTARRVQKGWGVAEQDVLTVSLLEGTDGVRKMSKTYRNTVDLEDSPSDMFGKIMSTPDGLIGKYFRLLTDTTEGEIVLLEQGMKAKRLNPKDVKADLARRIVTSLTTEREAQRAEEEFQAVFRDHRTPKDVPLIFVIGGTYAVVDFLAVTKLAKSRSEAQRLIRQGGVDLDGQVIRDPKTSVTVKDGMVLKVGKRRFARLRVTK